MLTLFFLVCIVGLGFFVLVLVKCSPPRRKHGSSSVRKLTPQEVSDSETDGVPFFAELERQMKEFLPPDRTAASLLLLLAISSISARAQQSPPPDTTAPNQQQPATQSSASQAPAPLSSPSITGPLQAAPPITFEAGPFGKLNFDGVISGMGLWQSNHVPGDNTAQAALSNGQVILQKTTSWWQFYVQAGAYDILSLGMPFLSTQKSLSDLYGPVPVAYLKLVPGKSTSIMIGSLPTLMGAEYPFTFQNMNIERGLLWNQENTINRGIQVNQALGKFTASFSWNDGYYSNRYSWLSGSLTYSNGPHSLSFLGMGNLSRTTYQTLATPVQNNGLMYAAIYTYTKGKWIVQPYFQYGDVPTNRSVGVFHGASTWGGAVLASRPLKHGFSLAGRGEYITSTGGFAQQSVNLLYGPGSGGWSITLTPTYQYQRFFARADLAWVQAIAFTPGSAFGSAGTSANQPRAVFEVGFLF
ncbi:MAG TPA: outer membrane beta-barrel protein [Terriglobales bacterium]|nr:outer membrane beta-barrel protein [Terriglobales bacterium]